MFHCLLKSGAKPNIEFKRILARHVGRATPWEEILAKAIMAFGDRVGSEERENVSNAYA